MKQIGVLPLLLLILAASAISLNAAATWDKNTLEAKIDSLVLISKEVPTDGPGCAVAIVQDGEIIFKKGYGLANLEQKTPIGPQTVFSIASMSKQFTAACILLLAQEGKLSLDDEIHQYIPKLPDFGQPVTIRQLIHHTSGIYSSDILLLLAGHRFDEAIDNERMLEMIFRCHTLDFSPGAEHQYSNSGYILLSEIVHRVSGKPLPQFAAERIFQPLGMRSTQICDDPRRKIANEAIGYVRDDSSNWQNSGARKFITLGETSVYSTVEDLARWQLNFLKPTVGGPRFAEQMMERGILNNGDTTNYAFGLEVTRIGGQLAVQHGGYLPGFHSYKMYLPEYGFSAICLTNNISLWGIDRELAEIALGNIFADEEDTADSTQTGAPAVVDVPSQLCRLYVGKYQMKDGFTLEIIYEDGVLKGQGGGQPKLPLLAESDSLFHLEPAPEVKILFPATNGRPADHFTLLQNGEQRFERLADQPPTREELAEFAGNYYSDELDATYRLELSASGDKFVMYSPICDPFFRINFGITGQDTLAYAGGDGCMYASMPIKFQRNEQGAVTGFRMSYAGRLRNILFIRR